MLRDFFLLLLFGVFVYWVVTGEVTTRGGVTIRRKEHPGWYWFIVATVGGAFALLALNSAIHVFYH
jgi:hypothetical protein